MQIFTHFVQFEPKYKLEKTSKFKFNKGTIDIHSTIADRQDRMFLHFSHISQLLSSFVLSTTRITSQYVSLWLQSIAHSGFL